MSEVLTAFELHHQMIEKSHQIDEAVFDYQVAAKGFAEAKSQSEYAQALHYPKTKGTVDERKHQVNLKCNGQMYTELLSEASRNASDRALKARMAQLSALQSLAAALREELRLARTSDYAT